MNTNIKERKPSLTEEQEKLITDNMALVHYLLGINLRRYPHLEMSEIESACYFGIFKSALTFDNTKKVKFSSYASVVINREVNRRDYYYQRRRQHIIHFYELNSKGKQEDAYTGYTPDEDLAGMSYITSREESPYRKVELRHEIKKLLSVCTPLQKDIFILYSKGYSYDQVAKKLNIGKGKLFSERSKAIVKMTDCYSLSNKTLVDYIPN